MKTKYFTLAAMLFCLTACASVRTQEETLKIWFPNDQYLRDMDTVALAAEADSGWAEAQLHLGMRLMTGDRIERDEIQGAALFRELAEAGDPRGAFFLGAAYSGGAGVQKDDDAAARWYKESAEAGYDKGQFWYGFMLSTGRGVESADQAAAVYWFRKAAYQGDSNAQFSLGEAYDSCRGGLPRDFDRAAYWYRLAEGGKDNMLARFNLRRLIDLGLTEWQEGDPGVRPSDTIPVPIDAYQPCPENVKDPIAYLFAAEATKE
jgi:TPR repeat protein